MKWLTFFAAVFLCGASHAQSAVGFVRAGSIGQADFNDRLAKRFGKIAPAPIKEPVDLYTVRYRSRDYKNSPVILSGLVAIPRNGAKRGLIVFCHGTTADRSLSPSRWTGKNESPEVEVAVLAFASGGYAVALPDYPGLGVHAGTHPYPLAEINSVSAVDIVAPARAVGLAKGSTIGKPLFVSGYSEGGAVGMCAVRRLERSVQSVRSAALMSGPYDLSGVTAQSLVAPTGNQTIFAARLYLAGYMMHSLRRNGGTRIADYFKPAMANTIAYVYDRGYTDVGIIKRLSVTAMLMRAKNSMDNVTTVKFRDALRNPNSTDPILRELRKSDCFDWTPRTPLLLTCLETDGIVVAENTHKTVKAMRARGLGMDKVREYMIRDANLNHATAVPYSLVRARRFFDKGF